MKTVIGCDNVLCTTWYLVTETMLSRNLFGVVLTNQTDLIKCPVISSPTEAPNSTLARAAQNHFILRLYFTR